MEQTVCVPTGLPGALGHMQVRLSARSATASELVIDVTEMDGDTTFTNMVVGAPLPDTRRGGSTFGDSADAVRIDGLVQKAVVASARSFVLSGLSLSATFSGGC
jgi:hypothetical protein